MPVVRALPVIDSTVLQAGYRHITYRGGTLIGTLLFVMMDGRRRRAAAYHAAGRKSVNSIDDMYETFSTCEMSSS